MRSCTRLLPSAAAMLFGFAACDLTEPDMATEASVAATKEEVIISSAPTPEPTPSVGEEDDAQDSDETTGGDETVESTPAPVADCSDDDGDEDGDLVCDSDDICPGGNDLKLDDDGVIDTCPIRVLSVRWSNQPGGENFINPWLDARFGMKITEITGDELPGIDYSEYDVVAIHRNANPLDAKEELIAAVEAGDIGVVLHLNDFVARWFDMGIGQSPVKGKFEVEDNDHWVTDGYDEGKLDLSFTWKIAVDDVGDSANVLGSTPEGACLLAHNDQRVIITPFYGDEDGFPMSEEGMQIFWRSYLWASGAGSQ